MAERPYSVRGGDSVREGAAEVQREGAGRSSTGRRFRIDDGPPVAGHFQVQVRKLI